MVPLMLSQTASLFMAFSKESLSCHCGMLSPLVITALKNKPSLSSLSFLQGKKERATGQYSAISKSNSNAGANEHRQKCEKGYSMTSLTNEAVTVKNNTGVLKKKILKMLRRGGAALLLSTLLPV